MKTVSGRKKSDLDAVGKTVWLDLMRCLFRARRLEERLIRLYHQGKIYGGVYTGIGQEATGAAMVLAAGPEDLFAPCIRNQTVHLGRGETVPNIFRQWLARAGSPTRGRDGNVHYGNLRNGVYTMISHLGAMIPVVVGGVMAKRRRGIEAVGVAFVGDGATSTGDFHEGVNFAAVCNVPVVILIENNHYAYSTPTNLQYRCGKLVDRAPGYGIEGYEADGNDPVGLYLLARDLLEDIRRNPRAVLLECDTMRMRGHGEHDDFSYVPRELLDAYAKRDPILVAARRLVDEGALTREEIDALDREATDEVAAALLKVMAEPPPAPSSLTEGVYARG
ncbi:MAG: thiamine pyrophosphate-dependent dehydrogenase E1 component subunit alpha [bacterium]